jgi:hypothetical protein
VVAAAGLVSICTCASTATTYRSCSSVSALNLREHHVDAGEVLPGDG